MTHKTNHENFVVNIKHKKQRALFVEKKDFKQLVINIVHKVVKKVVWKNSYV